MILILSNALLITQVKILNWVDGVESDDFFTGLTAQFGAALPSDADQGVRSPVAFVRPLDSCSNLSSRVSRKCDPFSKSRCLFTDSCSFALFQLDGSIALSIRGSCAFTEKAKHAEAAGASALLVINDKEGFFVFLKLWSLVDVFVSSNLI